MKLRVTCVETMTPGTDTTQRDGHYVTVGQQGDTVEECVARLLRNEFHQGDFFKPGECVDVEEHFGLYIGRFRLNEADQLVKLPPPPTTTTGGTAPKIKAEQGPENGGVSVTRYRVKLPENCEVNIDEETGEVIIDV